MTLFTVLTLIFTVLKLTGYIAWGWFYVVLPSIIHLVLYVLISVLIELKPLWFINRRISYECVRGHPWTEENTSCMKNGKRIIKRCVICYRANIKKRDDSKKTRMVLTEILEDSE